MDKQRAESINSCIEGVKRRDKKSLDMLYDMIASAIRYIAHKYLDEQDAEDLVQDFWAHIYNISDRFVYHKNGFGFLCKVMNRLAINRCKKLKTYKKHIVHYVNYSRLNNSADSCTIEDINLRIMVEKAMDKLDEKEKIIMQLTFFEDKTIVQIAKELKMSKSTVGRLQLSAKEKLKKEFSYFLGKNRD